MPKATKKKKTTKASYKNVGIYCQRGGGPWRHLLTPDKRTTQDLADAMNALVDSDQIRPGDLVGFYNVDNENMHTMELLFIYVPIMDITIK